MRVLVATDGSACAEVAVELVRSWPWPAGTSVRVVEAIESGAGLFGGPWPAIAIAESEELEAELRREAAGAVDRAREQLAAAGLEAEADVLRGRPAAAIIDAARAFAADVIVVGSRGHGAIESMVLGSVSAEIVDHSPIPVLVARHRGLDRVVLAWDGSASGREAARLVHDWPVFAGASVRVVSVADIQVPWWTGFPAAGSPEMMPLYVEAAEVARETHTALARDLAAELQAMGIEATPDAREGDAATEILRSAAEISADMIVLGTHGRTGLTRLVLGSVARNVLHHAKCSVLIAPDPSRRH